MATSMTSFRRMYTITAPIQRKLEIPNIFNNSKSGKRPTTLVAYTPVGARMMHVHLVPGTIYWELSNEEVDSLMNDLHMQEHEHLELESHSNTDLIIRAYYESGQEKFFDSYVPPPFTHKTTHFRAVIHMDSKHSLNVNSTFQNQVTVVEPRSYSLKSYVSDYKVEGNAQPGKGEGFVLRGEIWEKFCLHHKLRPGMILVFEHVFSRNTYDFNVLIYYKDGSECTSLTCMPKMFNQAEYSFYRRRDSKLWKENNMKLKTCFTKHTESARRLFFGNYYEITLSILAGNFVLDYERDDDTISGDWDAVFNRNNFNNNKVKYQLSFNNVASSMPVIFAVEFIDEYSGYISTEDETASGESFNDYFTDDFD